MRHLFTRQGVKFKSVLTFVGPTRTPRRLSWRQQWAVLLLLLRSNQPPSLSQGGMNKRRRQTIVHRQSLVLNKADPLNTFDAQLGHQGPAAIALATTASNHKSPRPPSVMTLSIVRVRLYQPVDVLAWQQPCTYKKIVVRQIPFGSDRSASRRIFAVAFRKYSLSTASYPNKIRSGRNPKLL